MGYYYGAKVYILYAFQREREENIRLSQLFLGYWNVSVILTYFELISAVTGIFAAADGKLLRALLCLVVCGVCDMFDGKIARATKRSEDACVFGIQIDSLCDLVSFGVLPAVMGYGWGIAGWARTIPAIFVLCGLIRLAYFNVSEQKRRLETEEKRKYYEGLPITSSALIVPLLCVLSHFTNIHMAKLMPIGLLAMAVLFISRIKVKKPQI